MNTSKNLKAAIAGFGAAVLLSSSAIAGSGKMAMEMPPVSPDPWDYCDIFDMGKLYKSDTGFITKFALIGRYHGQYHWSDSNQSGLSEDWENRRSRFGVQIGFLGDFEFEGQFNLDWDGDRFFKDVEDLYVVYEPSDDFYAIVGKVKPKITREYSTSSKRIKTVERSQLVNQVVPDKIGGFIVGGNVTEQLFVEGAVCAGSNDDDWGLPYDGDSELAASLRVGYDITESTNVRLDYFYADGAGVDENVEEYDHILSLSTQSDWDRVHLVTDLVFASGIDDNRNSDAWSVVVMPYYDITDKLEAVLRYTYSAADGDEGIRLQSRYERETAADQRGDEYHAIYGGLNYYICGDKLKLMGGVEYSTLSTESAGRYKNWTVFTGVRLYF